MKEELAKCTRLTAIEYDPNFRKMFLDYETGTKRDFENDWYDYGSGEDLHCEFYEFVRTLGEVKVEDDYDSGLICIDSQMDVREMERAIDKWAKDKVEYIRQEYMKANREEREAEEKRVAALAKLTEEEREILGV